MLESADKVAPMELSSRVPDFNYRQDAPTELDPLCAVVFDWTRMPIIRRSCSARRAASLSIEQVLGCWRCGRGALPSQASDLRPALHKRVVRERVGCTLLALADCIKSIGEIPSRFSSAAELRDERRGCAFAG